ncbi:MAG: mercury(II) reductase [Opitutae bacterium]|nr:mercury(II) reductase [Opitutae bacterium]
MSDCCSTQRTSPTQGSGTGRSGAEGKHLLIVGGGGAAFAAALKASSLGARVTIINDGLPMGGTCVNVGCVPSKTLLRAAESLHRAQHPPPFAGISTSGRLEDFSAVMRQKRELVEQLRQAKYADVIGDDPNITFRRGRGKLVDNRTVSVDGEHLHGDAVLIATGARPAIPAIPGLAQVAYLTNESAFEMTALPASLLVLGGRYIALEIAQLFARLGTRVTVLQRSARILPDQSPELTNALTAYLEAEGIRVVTGVQSQRVAEQNGEVVFEATVGGKSEQFRAERLLLATGRQPNIDSLGLPAVGVLTDERGFVQVDDMLATPAKGVFAAGDVIGEPMFVYTAAYEGALAAENALTGAGRTRDYTALPWVVFTDPQVAGVGLDEAEARKQGIPAEAVTLPLAQVPRAIAARDTRGFIQLIRNPETDQVLGARVLAPEGGELLMEVALAIRHGLTVQSLATAFHPYLTLGEGIKLAALSFGKDVKKLSCCAA